MTAVILRGDARDLPLPDESVDLVLCSPPYFGLRDYRDAGTSMAGQIGAEATPREYVASLIECTREWMRVLKPSGSLFVNLGDKYSDRGHGPDRGNGTGRGPQAACLPQSRGPMEKSLLGLPWRYALACTDDLGLILRAEIIWQKANGLPESVTDRVRRSHEQVFHFTRQPRYYSGLDEIREPHQPAAINRNRYARNTHTPRDYSDVSRGVLRDARPPGHQANALGKLPGSVWEIASAPLSVPPHLGVDHFAAYPPELCRRIILGWSPSGICTECGQGRRPVVDKPGLLGGDNNTERLVDGRYVASGFNGGQKLWAQRMARPDRITGYACACTPYTDHPERRTPTVTPSRQLGRGHQDNTLRASAVGSRHHGNDWPERQPVREYHFDAWNAAPTRPAVVLDPFAGTGTTLLVASVLGRTGIGVDRSADYCRLAQWRTADPAERARALGVPRPPVEMDGQLDMFGGDAA